MKKFFVAVAVTAVASGAWAQKTISVDSLDYEEMDEVQVMATRATKTTPVAFTNIGKEEIRKVNLGKDLPEILSVTPSVVTTSDAGAGIGYTTMRVRGTDGSRINVTANGIPINDAESHNVFWVNMPDLASSLKSIQIQRGVGTSTNGAGAFGATVNMVTTDFNVKPYAELAGSYGSFNTNKQTLKLGTGLINDHWTFDVRLSHIGTDGYLDRATVQLLSYYAQVGYYNGGTSVKLLTFGGKERTYHAWNYPSKEETALYGRRYNSCGYMFTDGMGRMHFYDDQTDNYFQHHYQLLFSHQFNSNWYVNAAAHFTKGDGYYQEYILGADLATYKLPAGVSDLTRKKEMDNGFGGGVFDVTYKNDRLQATFGGGVNKYTGWNYGHVLSVQNTQNQFVNANHEFYRYRGEKWDGNLYAKADYNFCKGLNGYVDLQWRHIDYRLRGENERWDYELAVPQNLNITRIYDFFNPKVGLSYQFRKHHRAYVSWSVAHKEPTRNNFIMDLRVKPRSERLFDYEAGYEFANEWLHAGANFYYMDYKDQLVLTGKLNEIGEPLSENVPDSYRMGVELSFGLKTKVGFSWDISATLSRNRVKNFVETLAVNDYDADWNYIGSRDVELVNHGDTHLAFSPDYTFVNVFRYAVRGFEVSTQTNFVSKQYMSNANQEDCTLDAYCTTNLALSYSWKNLRHFKGITVGCTVYNIFNAEYDNNGWASSERAYVNGVDQGRVNYSGYAAQAGTNVLGHVNLQF